MKSISVPRFDSMGKAQAWASKHLFKSVDFGLIPLEIAQEVTDHFAELDSFGVLKRMEFIPLSAACAKYKIKPPSDTLIGVVDSNTGAIAVSYSRAWHSPLALEREIRYLNRTHSLPGATVRGVLAHEYCHALQWSQVELDGIALQVRWQTALSRISGFLDSNFSPLDAVALLGRRHAADSYEMVAEIYRLTFEGILPPEMAQAGAILKEVGLL